MLFFTREAVLGSLVVRQQSSVTIIGQERIVTIFTRD
jgi:hypothetical protein